MDINVSVIKTTEDAETLKDNIVFFCTTPKGSLPQNREYGLDFSVLDKPFAELKMKLTVDIITGIRKYYGIQITDIGISAKANGGVEVKIEA